jgi:hypothetical protein
MRSPGPGTVASVSGTLTRCGACGRETTTTEDGRCHYCGRPKPVAEPVAAETETYAPRRAPSVWEELRPQLVCAAVSALLVVVALVVGSQVLLYVAAIVLVGAVVAAVATNGW